VHMAGDSLDVAVFLGFMVQELHTESLDHCKGLLYTHRPHCLYLLMKSKSTAGLFSQG
jgi:hypothetical protein